MVVLSETSHRPGWMAVCAWAEPAANDRPTAAAMTGDFIDAPRFPSLDGWRLDYHDLQQKARRDDRRPARADRGAVAVAALALVVVQGRPRQRMILLADAEEAAERHQRIDRLAAHLVDHAVVDGAELLALAGVDFSVF